ncbi:MAG: hypothetical protein HQM14_17125 [SAR324 cluster bacterium]|nr:hypothetical protein [SAR324 cluster bacterium]
MDLLIAQKDNIFHLKGVINEFAKFNQLFEFTGSEMLLNLKEIRRINSTGVRELINAIEKVDHRIDMIFEECPPIVVYQMAMIPNFTLRVKVTSVYAPYYCPECDHQEEILIDMANFNLEQSLPEEVCKKCGAELEFDDDEESYFYFMEHA